jgi:hypothetical protein
LPEYFDSCLISKIVKVNINEIEFKMVWLYNISKKQAKIIKTFFSTLTFYTMRVSYFCLKAKVLLISLKS